MKHFIFYILFILISCTVAAQRVNKSIVRIRKQLNNFELEKALRNIDDLIKEYPKESYYKDLKVYTYKQIINRINYAKEIIGEPDKFDDDENDSDSNALKVLDAIDSLEMGLYPKKQTPDIVKSNLAKDTVASTSKSKKKKRKFNWGDDDFGAPEETATVTIDSNIIKGITTADMPKEIIIKEDKTEDDNNDSPNTKAAKRAEKAAKRAQEILEAYASMDANFYKTRIINEAKQYSLLHEHVDSCNQYLYDYLIDTVNKKIISDSVSELIESADEAFAANEFDQALKQYNDAMQLAPDYTEIYFKMAMVYFSLKEDSMCNLYLKTIKIMEPNNSEMIYKMGMFYFNNGDYKKAVQYALKAIKIYPHSKYFSLIKACAGKTASDFNSQWMARKVMPINAMVYKDKLAKNNDPWFYYQQAKQRYGMYCNIDCTIKPNDSIAEKYLEVAAWMDMLDSSKVPTDFLFAKQIRKVGFLDCYTLITLYHVELYSQFNHLVTHNPEKVLAYFELLFEWERPRFDKFKKIEVLEPKDKKKKKK